MRYLVEWETELNPGRPHYHGKIEVFGIDPDDARFNARQKIARNMVMTPSEIRVVAVAEDTE